MNNSKEGKGCNFNDDVCLVKFENSLMNNCPCQNCLIKVVCKIQCDKRRFLFITLSDDQKDFLRQNYLNYIRI